jgi:hypothetical protein
MYDNPWTINNTTFEETDVRHFKAFVYLITDTETGIRYIGKKNFFSMHKQSKTTRKVCVQSDWKKYYSSSKLLKSLVRQHGKERFKREIIRLCVTPGESTFFEQKYQFEYGVLLEENRGRFYNEAIGKFRRHYRNDSNWEESFIKGKTHVI